MTHEELLQHYRLLDAAYGTLETSERIRGELVELRRDQLRMRKKSVWDRLLVLLITLTTGVPVLLGILPKKVLAPREAWVTLFVGLTLCYAAMALYNWAKEKTEENEIASREDVIPYQRPEDDPKFLEMRLITFITRLSLAGEILATDPPDSMRAAFEDTVKEWVMRIDREGARIEKLYELRQLSDERYRRMRSWIDQVISSHGSM